MGLYFFQLLSGMKYTFPCSCMYNCICFIICILSIQGVHAQPIITSFSPISGSIGTTLTITGINFNPTPTNNIIYFGAVKGTTLSASPNSLTVNVPAGTSYDPISVTTSNLTAYSGQPFIVTFPGGGTQFLPGSFAAKVDFVTGTNPQSVTGSDIDGDGKVDMAVANGTSNTISVFRNTGSNGNISFATKVDFATGASPLGIFMGDLDGDGKPDAVMANYTSNSITILKNTSSPGNISFAPKVDYLVGDGPYITAIQDLDNDGKPDLVTVNNTSNTISIIKNTGTNGNITFSSRVDYTTGINPQNVSLSDLDGDHLPEMAVINANDNNLSVYRNISAGNTISFASKIDFSTGSKPYGISSGDLDGDGKAELVTANGGSVSILRNLSINGSIAFADKIDFSAGSIPLYVTINDLDGDGKPDLAVANYGSNTVTISKNLSTIGNISFAAKVSYQMGAGPVAIALGDFDSDGLTDIAVANANANTISIRRSTVVADNSPNISSFTPTSGGPGTEITINGTDLTGATSVTLGGTPVSSFNVESSTVLKAVVGSGASGIVSVTTPFGTATGGGFTYTTLPTISSFTPVIGGNGTEVTIVGTNFLGTTAVTFGGTNATSYSVVSPTIIKAVVDTGSSGNVSVTTAYGQVSKSGFTFTRTPSISSYNPSRGGSGTEVTITGVNFTGVTSVSFGGNQAISFTVLSPTTIKAIVGAVAPGSIPIRVITAYGEALINGFYTGPTITSFTPTFGPVGTIVTITGTNFSNIAGDNIVNFGDVKALVVAANATSISVVTPFGSTYQPITVINNSLTASSHKPFNVTFTYGDSAFYSSSFDAKNVFKGKPSPLGVSIADIDGDGKPDMATADYESNTVSIYKNVSRSGSILFNPRTEYSGSFPYRTLLRDFDGDAKPDLVVLNNDPYSSTFSLFRNTSGNGNLSFSTKVDYGTGYNPRSVATGDFDGDGKPDLVVGNEGANVSIYKNISAIGSVSFASKIELPTNGTTGVSVGDYNNDGLPDIAIIGPSDIVSVFKNTSRNGVISFDTKVNFQAGFSPLSIFSADVDGDSKLDICVSNGGNDNVSIFRNTSASGSIAFDPKVDYPTGADRPYSVSINDMNGDGKPDIVVTNTSSSSVSVFSNLSNNGIVSFSPAVSYYTGFASSPRHIDIADMDGDGKPDIAVADQSYKAVTVLRNRLGEPSELALCNLDNTSITSNLTGINYQWQVNTGAGFTNIADDNNYSGTKTINLQLTNVPSSWYGYQYRNVVDGSNGDSVRIKFVNSWTGQQNSDWANSANWSCGSVPNADTDVIINSGPVVLNSDALCRSLKLNPGVVFTINPGFTLIITH